MNQIRDVLGPLLTTQGFGFILLVAGATIGAAFAIASGAVKRTETRTGGELVALVLCLAMVVVGLAYLLFPEHLAQIKFPTKEVFR